MNYNINLKKFYEENIDFDYFSYREALNSEFIDKSEKDVIHFWINNNKQKIIKIFDNNSLKNIIIYAFEYTESSGGISCLYKLAYELDKKGFKVRIFLEKNNKELSNNIFSNYYNNDFNLEETIIIYPEIIKGNPLNGKYVVRWLLADIGIIANKKIYNSWNHNDLVYYFNYKKDFDLDNNIYKILCNISVNKIFENTTNNKSGFCHTFKKSKLFHNNIEEIHPKNSFNIKNESHQQLQIIMNRYKYFVSYDPLTFLIHIANLCGCISIVYPIKNLSKFDWIKTTAFYPYLKKNNLDNIYGIAYGNSPEELDFAEKTLHLAKTQIYELELFYKDSINNFIYDLNNWNSNNNTVKNIFIK